MQERNKNEHYSEQRGHWQRGLANKFREKWGYRPQTFSFEPIFLAQPVQDIRRRMRRPTRDGRD